MLTAPAVPGFTVAIGRLPSRATAIAAEDLCEVDRTCAGTSATALGMGARPARVRLDDHPGALPGKLEPARASGPTPVSSGPRSRRSKRRRKKTGQKKALALSTTV